jgi:uncharacterized integral membrane protein
LFVFVPVFFAFSLLPIVLIRLTLGKPARTIFSADTKKIQFFTGKDLLYEANFTDVSLLNQSRYTYTVKTKNGSRTVTVYTTTSPSLPDRILAESTDFYQSRRNAETIAKLLQIPLTNEQGEKRELHELDLPFHKRPHPEFDSFKIPNFETESELKWQDTGTEFKLTSNYNPILFRILGGVLSAVLFLIFHLSIGDIFEVAFFSWKSFPPTLPETIFFVVATIVSLIPIGFAFYLKIKKKEIRITNEGVGKDGDFISFAHLEEVILEDNHLNLIGDEKIFKLGLMFFCKNENYNEVEDAVIYGILSKTNGGANSSFSKFTTEF